MKHKTCMLEDVIRYFDLYYCHLYVVCYFVKANKSFGTLCWDKTTQDGPETVLDFSSLGGRRWKHMLLGKMTCCAKSIWHELKTPKSAMFAWVWCGISVFQMVLHFPPMESMVWGHKHLRNWVEKRKLFDIRHLATVFFVFYQGKCFWQVIHFKLGTS